MNSSANFASEAEDTTTLIICDRERTGPLSREIGSLSEHKICNPAGLQVRVPLRYAMSDCAVKNMFMDL